MPAPGEQRTGNGISSFVVLDPTGNTVCLDENRWKTHISVYHPEVAQQIENVEKAVREPDAIIKNSCEYSTYYYYRLTGKSQHRADDIYLAVCVQIDLQTKSGFVKTAHLCRTIRNKGSELIWLNRK
jgi:hypothetical protein